MQWGEGSTNWRSVTSLDDLLAIGAGCNGLEIAGIGFIGATAAKDAINFTGISYSVHIHDCCFVGDVGAGSAGVMVYGINADGSKAPDLYVHDCKFFRCKTTGIVAGNQRNVIKNNIFVVASAGHGIDFDGGATNGCNVIVNNYFFGTADTGCYGIYSVAHTAGNFIVAKNSFCNFAANKDVLQSATQNANFVENKQDGAEGADANVDPKA